jgi:hypothetical protein
MSTKISQLATASAADYNDDGQIPFNAVDQTTGEITTKKALLVDLKKNYFCDTQCANLSIATASVLTLNSVPLTIVAAQGAGTIIEPVSAVFYLDYNSAAYATNTQLQLKFSGASVGVCNIGNNILTGTVSKYSNSIQFINPAAAETQVIENADLQVTVDAGDPITGDSDIEVWVFYRKIDV